MSETREKGKVDKGPFDVSRRIPLAPGAAEKLQDAVRLLTALDPILDAHIDRRGHLRVSYAASHIDIRDIEILLDKAGIARASASWWRLKSAWCRFLDGNARANARSQGGACCNRPPAASGSGRDAGKMG